MYCVALWSIHEFYFLFCHLMKIQEWDSISLTAIFLCVLSSKGMQKAFPACWIKQLLSRWKFTFIFNYWDFSGVCFQLINWSPGANLFFCGSIPRPLFIALKCKIMVVKNLYLRGVYRNFWEAATPQCAQRQIPLCSKNEDASVIPSVSTASKRGQISPSWGYCSVWKGEKYSATAN